MRTLTPLTEVAAIDEATRAALAAYWITSVEELVATARSSNAGLGSGLAALAQALGRSEDEVRAMVMAALEVAPDASSFSVDVAMEPVGTGAIFDDLPEVDAAAFSPPVGLPAEVPPLMTLPPPVSQGPRNTCVAFTIAAMVQTLSKDPTDLSEQFIYWISKDRDRIPGDVGTNPLVALRAVAELGVCREETWPYRPEPVDHANPGHERPSEAAFREAKQRRIAEVEQLPARDVNQIKAALAAGKPVLIGLMIGEHWTSSGQVRRIGRVRRALPGEQKLGGHAMCALGYRDDPTAPGGGYFIVRNSWGSDWANENPDGPGYCYVPYQLIFDEGLAALVATGVIVEQPNVATPALGAEQSDDLAAILAEAQAIRARLDALIERIGALAGGRPQPVAPVAAASQPDPTPAPPVVAGYSGPLILIAGEQSAEELYPNGIDGRRGEPLLRIDAKTASDLAQRSEDPKELQMLHKTRNEAEEKHFGVVAEVDQEDIAQARWALVVSATDDARIIEALWPLIEHRAHQQGIALPAVAFRPGETCAEWASRYADIRQPWEQRAPVLVHRPNERVNGWLARHGTMAGPVKPSQGVPFYLLIAARPGPLAPNDQAFISFNFQYELDIFWGVGRVCFIDERGQHRYADYTTYAQRLVDYERRKASEIRLRREIVYFGTRHDLDKSTERSAVELVTPLANWHDRGLPQRLGYGKRLLLAKDATRSNLELALRDGNQPPAIFFSATHGLGLPANDRELIPYQGALVTQDWTGFGGIKREHWFAAEDLPGNLSLEGMVALLFACYGAGCPQQDEFIFDPNKGRPVIAPFAFVAQLPQQMLLRGALGVVGHVERAWTYGFSMDGARGQTQSFEDVIGRLVAGKRLGSATDQFNIIQAARSLTLAEELENIKFGKQPDPRELSTLWMARNDARNYMLLGDPAARVVV
ncbi:C1 family peptidase [Chloroflexus sp.]|uniref:C1 family peptidase n=1 Tax=Chloroflexus sp. TaxID=1904827 RepID=UPI00298EFE9D|nr:C1 family peptidase [Chloroflexus sp.]MCS6886979.1 C1 family peptidase [Chloroflexus sp.]MDW8405275.1 C1 family peptidase [Chloroflexus sp.]